jgi:hypothetical protein
VQTIGSARKRRLKFCVLHGLRAAQTRIKGGRVGETTSTTSSRGKGGGVSNGFCLSGRKREEYQMRFQILWCFIIKSQVNWGVVDSATSYHSEEPYFESWSLPCHTIRKYLQKFFFMCSSGNPDSLHTLKSVLQMISVTRSTTLCHSIFYMRKMVLVGYCRTLFSVE